MAAIAVGETRSLALTRKGQVVSWEVRAHLSWEENGAMKPAPAVTQSGIVAIAASRYVSLALTKL